MAEPDINDFMIVDGAKYVITSVNRDEVNGITEYQTTPSFDFATDESYTFTRDNGEHAWTFSTAGYLHGPTETGRLRVTGIINDDGDIYVQSDQDVVIGGGESNGEFLNDPTDPDNQIATIGDVNAARFGASASFFSTADQGPQASADLVQAFTFNNTDWATGITLANNSRITMTNSGKYNLAFSAQLYQTNNTGNVNIWLNKNGSPVANTNTKVTMNSNNHYLVAAWNFFVDSAANDYYQIMWSSSSTNTSIQYDPEATINGNVHPAIPSIILTVNQVG
jgi:hypothetical protein